MTGHLPPDPGTELAPLPERAAHAVDLLTALPKRPIRDELERVITALEALQGLHEAQLLWRCPRCHAEALAPCVRPDGTELRYGVLQKPASHAQRIDRGIAGYYRTLTEPWRYQLAEDGPTATRTVARKIQQSALAKQLTRLRQSGCV